MGNEDIFSRMLALSGEGYMCSQILLLMTMESQGKENPDLIRAMGGLTGGMGFSGKTCGALTGGACLLGYFAAKGDSEDRSDGRAQAMITEFVQWFEEEIGTAFGGINCSDILEDNPSNTMLRCPGVVARVYEKALAILEENGYDL